MTCARSCQVTRFCAFQFALLSGISAAVVTHACYSHSLLSLPVKYSLVKPGTPVSRELINTEDESSPLRLRVTRFVFFTSPNTYFRHYSTLSYSCNRQDSCTCFVVLRSHQYKEPDGKTDLRRHCSFTYHARGNTLTSAESRGNSPPHYHARGECLIKASFPDGRR